MRRPPFVFGALTMIGAAAAFAQPAPSPSPSEGLELLKQVAQHYADAKSYYIESVEENISSTEYNHSWQKRRSLPPLRLREIASAMRATLMAATPSR